ncbi:IclR family transcriptional regulator C-terminal domain-containing protein [Streptomonospora sediminis]
MSAVERRDHLQTLERGLAVISAFSDTSDWLSLTDLAKATGLTKPTVRRILLTLESLGYARSDGNRFALTPKVLGLGYAYLSSLDLTRVAAPLLEALTERLGLGTSLATLDGSDVVYVHRVQRHRVTSINLAVGTRLPAHATSMGHVLLADLTEDAVERYLAQAPLHALTERTVTDPSALRERIRLVRERGWDVVDQELETGRRSAAAPVRDAGGQVIAALSLSCGAAERTVRQIAEDLTPPLCQTAADISDLLGGNRYSTQPEEAR